MNSDTNAFALQNVLNEIKNACPKISNTFIFKNEKVLAKDENTDEETANSAARAFNAIAERANTIGGLESVALKGTNGYVNLACIDDLYFVAVTSDEIDGQYVNALARVLIPTVLKLVEKLHPAHTGENFLRNMEAQPTVNNYTKELPTEENRKDALETVEETPFSEVNFDSWLPEPSVHQFLVENTRGLMTTSDTVHINEATIAQWKSLYGDKKLKVVVETLNGKTIRCKFKPIKNSKYAEKGIIQIPKKIQRALQTMKGELVLVKPVVE